MSRQLSTESMWESAGGMTFGGEISRRTCEGRSPPHPLPLSSYVAQDLEIEIGSLL